MTVDAYLAKLDLSLDNPPTSPFKMEKIVELAGKSVLDIGCRDGAYVAFCQAVGKYAVGIDLSPAPSPNSYLPLMRANAQALPLDDCSFDTVLMFDLLEHVPDEALALQEAARVGRRNILLSLPKPDAPSLFSPWNGLTYRHYIDQEHRRYYAPDYIRSLVERLGYEVASLEHWCPIHPADVYIGAGVPRLLGRLVDRAMLMFVRDHLGLMRNLFVEVRLTT